MDREQLVAKLKEIAMDITEPRQQVTGSDPMIIVTSGMVGMIQDTEHELWDLLETVNKAIDV